MKKYRCKSMIDAGNRQYEIGEVVELLEEDAEPLIKCDAIEPYVRPRPQHVAGPIPTRPVDSLWRAS